MAKEINNTDLYINGNITAEEGSNVGQTIANIHVDSLYDENSPEGSIVVWSETNNSWKTQNSLTVDGVFTTSEDIDLKDNFIENSSNTFRVKCSFNDKNISFTPLYVEAGRESIYVIDNIGRLYTTGSKDNYSLGGVIDGATNFLELKNNSWVNVRSGGKFESSGDFVMAIDRNGTMYGWGDCTYGQCGTGDVLPNDFKNILTPNRIVGDSVYFKKWSYVSCGEVHAGAIDDEGYLYLWGKNNEFNTLLTLPLINKVCTKIGNKKWKSVECGSYHTIAIDEDDVAYAWGKNSDGQLGIGTDTIDRVSVQTIVSLTYHYQSNTPLKWGNISCGANFSAGLDLNGVMYVWGSNSHGQLGQGTPTIINSNKPIKLTGDFAEKKWKSVVCGSYHIAAIDLDDRLFVWGSSRDYQLGVSYIEYQYTPVLVDKNLKYASVACGLSHTVMVDEYKQLWVTGNFRNNKYQTPQKFKNTQIDVDNKNNLNVLNVKRLTPGVFEVTLKKQIPLNVLVKVIVNDKENITSSYNIINSNTIVLVFTKDNTAYEPSEVLLAIYNTI